MHYDAKFEMIALVFLLGIAFHFLTTQKFPSKINKYFSCFLILGILHNALDILGAYTIAHAATIPMWINEVVNLLFFNTLLLLPAAFFAYVLVRVESSLLKEKEILIALFVPYVVFQFLLLLNPLNHTFFYFANGTLYQHGPFYTLLIFSAALYFTFALTSLFIHRKALRKREFNSILAFLFVLFAAVIVQNIFPTYLIIGVALAFAIGTVYLNMQNPCDMLDSSTGAFNRNSFVCYMSERIYSKYPYQFILIKIDDMHVINNMFGTGNGEKLAISVADYLASVCVKGTRVFRKFFDSFIVVTEFETPEAFEQFVHKVRNDLNNYWNVGSYSGNLSVSIAYTYETKYFENENNAVESFFHMYYTLKDKGRRAFIVFDALMIQKMVRHDENEVLLRDAVENNRIEINLQPIFSPHEGQFVFAEALARIRRVDNKIIMPGDFIEIAEKNGMISKVSEQVLDRVCHFIKESGLIHTSAIQRISINLSVIECEDEGIADRILSTLEKYQIPPEFISLEITETAAMTSEKLPFIMNKLKDKGIIFMLDDLGTGYSNVNALLRLPFSYVKISRDTMLKSINNEKGAVVFNKTVEIIHSLGLHSIAEGAETDKHVQFLNSAGINYIQGFRYARPLTTEAFIDFIQQNHIA